MRAFPINIKIIKIFIPLYIVLFIFLTAHFIRPGSYDFKNRFSWSKAVYDTNGELLRLTLSDDDKYRLYTPLSEISSFLVEGTLLKEDQYFYYHPGFNPYSLFRAFYINYISGDGRSGGSTLTMQLARLVYRLNTKSVFGKIKQILRAVQLEFLYSKKEILEAYLNLAPYGRNIEGVGAACVVYFKKNVKELTLPDGLFLSIIPQNPSLLKFHKSYDKIPEDLTVLRDRLYKKWLKKHPIDMNKKELFELPFTMHSINDLPFLAPHFVN